MCLLVELVLPTVLPAQAGEVSRAAAAERDLLELRALRAPKGATESRFRICEPGEGCACSLLSDQADAESGRYELTVEASKRLAGTLEFISRRHGRFHLAATWTDGEFEPSRAPTRRILLRELLRELGSGTLPGDEVLHVEVPAGAAV